MAGLIKNILGDEIYNGCYFLYDTEFDIFTCKAKVWWNLFYDQYSIWIWLTIGVTFGALFIRR